MKFEDIKNMSKQEFEQFLFKVQSSNQKFCVRCGNFTLVRKEILWESQYKEKDIKIRQL